MYILQMKAFNVGFLISLQLLSAKHNGIYSSPPSAYLR